MLERDDVMEGGDEQHEAIMTAIASKITFAQFKEVRQFDGCCLTEGDGSRMESVWISRSKSRTKKQSGR